jgi:hypothetical protein
MKDFIIEMAVVILAKAIKAKPESKIAKLLSNEKLKKTVQDVYGYYVMLEMESEEDEG